MHGLSRAFGQDLMVRHIQERLGSAPATPGLQKVFVNSWECHAPSPSLPLAQCGLTGQVAVSWAMAGRSPRGQLRSCHSQRNPFRLGGDKALWRRVLGGPRRGPSFSWSFGNPFGQLTLPTAPCARTCPGLSSLPVAQVTLLHRGLSHAPVASMLFQWMQVAFLVCIVSRIQTLLLCVTQVFPA